MFSLRPATLEGDTYTRTPGRALKGVRQENLYRVPLTMNAKGKGAHTPHFSHTHKAGRSGAKPSIKNARPLLDKTPFPNRVASAIPLQTPAPKSGKLAKLALQDEPAQDALSAALLRPSSARKSIRLLKSSIQGKAQEFKTPITRGNHWDVSEDDVQMDEGVITEGKNAGEEEDYDEIEYMPPSAIIETYQPLFEMPDYSVAGKMLLELAHSAKIDDTLDLYYAQDIDKQIDVPALWVASGFASSPSKWERLPLSELEDDDPFKFENLQGAKPTITSAPNATASASATQSASLTSSDSTTLTHSSAALASRPATRASTRTTNATTSASTGTSRTGATGRATALGTTATASKTGAVKPGGTHAARSAVATRSNGAAATTTRLRSGGTTVAGASATTRSRATSSQSSDVKATASTRSAVATSIASRTRAATASTKPSAAESAGAAAADGKDKGKEREIVDNELIVQFGTDIAGGLDEDFLFAL